MTLFCVYLVFNWDNAIKNVFSKAGRSGLKRLEGGDGHKGGVVKPSAHYSHISEYHGSFFIYIRDRLAFIRCHQTGFSIYLIVPRT